MKKNVENTTGISSLIANDNITIRNVICQTFMADGFEGGTAYGSVSAFAYQGYTMTQGYVNGSNGVVTDNANAKNVYSDLIDVSVLAGSYANIWSGLGYQYVLDAHPSMLVLFYDEESTYISYEMTYQSYNFYVPTNAKYIRVVFTNVFNIPSTSASFRITSPSSQNFLLENVTLRNNCRGGASNVPNFCTFRKCKFYHNGKTSYEGAPMFGDSTRYAMDIEDIQSAGVTIDDCDEYDNGNGGFFLGAIDVTISNSRLTHVSLYRGVFYHITNSLVRSLRPTSNDFDTVNYFVEASNSTVVINSGGLVDLSKFTNCDVIFISSGTIKGPSNNNRIYQHDLQSYDALYISGDLAFTGYIDYIASADGKIIGSEGLSKCKGDLDRISKMVNCEYEWIKPTLYISKNQTFENCTLRNIGNLNPSLIDGTINIIYRNCDIVDVSKTIQVQQYKGALNVLFENCTFTSRATANDFEIANIRSYDELSLEFKNCTFINETEYTGYVSKQVSGYYKIPTFTNCTFTNVTPYPGYTE